MRAGCHCPSQSLGCRGRRIRILRVGGLHWKVKASLRYETLFKTTKPRLHELTHHLSRVGVAGHVYPITRVTVWNEQVFITVCSDAPKLLGAVK